MTASSPGLARARARRRSSRRTTARRPARAGRAAGRPTRGRARPCPSRRRRRRPSRTPQQVVDADVPVRDVRHRPPGVLRAARRPSRRGRCAASRARAPRRARRRGCRGSRPTCRRRAATSTRSTDVGHVALPQHRRRAGRCPASTAAELGGVARSRGGAPRRPRSAARPSRRRRTTPAGRPRARARRGGRARATSRRNSPGVSGLSSAPTALTKARVPSAHVSRVAQPGDIPPTCSAVGDDRRARASRRPRRGPRRGRRRR